MNEKSPIIGILRDITVAFVAISFVAVSCTSAYDYESYYYEMGYYDGYSDCMCYEDSGKAGQDSTKLTGSVLQRYTGTFVLQGYQNQTFNISKKNDRLFMTVQDTAPTAIIPDTDTTFFEYPFFMSTYEFELNPHSLQYDLTLNLCNGLKLKAIRIK